MGNKSLCIYCPFSNNTRIEKESTVLVDNILQDKIVVVKSSSIDNEKDNELIKINKNLILIQKFFRKIMSRKIFSKNFSENLFAIKNSENKYSKISIYDFINIINFDIKSLLSEKIGITSLEKINLSSILNNFQNIPSKQILNVSKVALIQLDPIYNKTQNNNSEYYWGQWNFNYKKHGIGILITNNEDLYLGTFKDNTIEGIGLLIINKKNIPPENKNDYLDNGLLKTYSLKHNQNQKHNSFNKKLDSNTKSNTFANCRNNSEALENKETYFKTLEDKNGNGMYNMNESANKSESLNKYNFEKEKNNKSNLSDYFKKMINLVSYPDDNNNYTEEENIFALDIYMGEFKNGMAEGYGRLFSKSGEWYIGNFKNNKKDGDGEFYFPDGSHYTGSFKNNMYDGIGKYFFRDGSHYSGEFKENKFNGKGIMAWNDGRVYNGIWEKNKMVGNSSHMWSNGDIYEGMYKNTIKTGKGIYYWDQSKFYEGQFLNNKFNGIGEYNYEDNVVKGDWKLGKLNVIKEISKKNLSMLDQISLNNTDFINKKMDL